MKTNTALFSGFLNRISLRVAPLLLGVFLASSAQAQLQVLHSFGPLTNGTNADGSAPVTALVKATDGNFYGTTSGGGHGDGTIFRITPGGGFTTLHSFSGVDGWNPGGLVEGDDGNFYGATNLGGASGLTSPGTIFKMTPSGALTTLYAFSGGTDGGRPDAPLVKGSDGNFYGTTTIGGTNSMGTIFKITPSGALTTLHNFANSEKYFSKLVQAGDGNFYGAARQGDLSSSGVIFRITPNGVYSVLNQGAYEYSNPGGLVLGSDGNIYGIGGWQVFSMTLDGTMASLCHIPYSSGIDGFGSPQGALVQGADGSLYGETLGSSLNNTGSLLKVTPSGILTKTFDFDPLSSGTNSTGALPWNGGNAGGLVQGADGSFYGVAHAGGANGTGVVFKFTPFPPPTVTTKQASGITDASATVSGTANPAGVATRVYFQYGTSSSYGSATAFQDAGSGTGDVGFSASLSGLTSLSTYHYRAVAISYGGVVYGADNTFTTTRSAPAITSPLVSTGTTGVGFSFQIAASNDPTSFGATGLPSGLSIDTATGLISGTPTTPGTFAVTLTACNTAQFYFASGVAVDGGGNVYVADAANNTVRRIAPLGTVSTFAGAPGMSGTADGTGSAAQFSNPAKVALDGSGNIYVADTFNGTIRRITPAGAVSTLAGTPGVSGAADGTGAEAQFSQPYGVAADGLGTVYVADTGNNTIRKITPAGVVSTLAGVPGVSGTSDGTGGEAQFNQPNGVAVDGDGNVYVADWGNNTIRKITPTGAVSTLAGTPGVSGTADGTGSMAQFSSPAGVSVDGSGTVYVADFANDTIRKITPSGEVSTLAGAPGVDGSADGTGSAARFSTPTDVSVDGNGNVYVADYGNFTIRKITPSGAVSTFAGTPGVSGTADSSGGGTTSATLVLTIASLSPSITSSLSATGTQGSGFSFQIVGSNNPTGYSAAGLPAGLGVDTDTGIISGTPTVSGTFGVALGATNAWGSGSATLSLIVLPPQQVALGSLAATFNSGTDVPVIGDGVILSGSLHVGVNFEPTPGMNLMLVKNTGPAPIIGTFDGVPQGGTVAVDYNGQSYNFIANYFGGSGNDLVLVWPNTGLAAWGQNGGGGNGIPGVGLLGDGTTTDQITPVVVTGTGAMAGKSVLAISDALYHSLALASDGRVYAWGYNAYGELGDGTTTNRITPVLVTGTGALAGKTMVAVSGGQYHSLALSSDGQVYAWGRGGFLGDGAAISRTTPVAVSSSGILAGKTVVAISAGGGHSLALGSDGRLYSWGSNSNGQLGDGTATNRLAPVAVSGSGVLAGKTVVAISAGNSHSLALTSDGRVYAWGSNSDGQLGDGTTTPRFAPVAVSSSGVLAGKTVVAISAGWDYSLALSSDGLVYAWGNNVYYGQLGDGTKVNRLTPVAVTTSGELAGKTVVAISAGEAHSLALTSEGRVYAWGSNGAGGLGNGTRTDSSVPVAVTTGSGALAGRFVSAISSGGLNSLAISNLLPPSITSNLTASGVLGAAFSYQIQASNNPTGYAAGGLPAGLTVNPATGLISGTAKTTGAFEVVLGATNGAGSGTANLALNILSPITTQAATGISTTVATARGTVNPNGFPTTVSFEYGTSSTLAGALSSSGTAIGSGTSAVAVAGVISGLAPSTKYYFRVKAVGGGTSRVGSILSFTTTATPLAPIVTPSLVQSVSASDAWIGATINPKGAATTVYFDYGQTTDYGSSTAAQNIGNGSLAVYVGAGLANLAPGTNYHYRVVSISALGTFYGPDQEFTTQVESGLFAVVSKNDIAPGIANARFSTFGNPTINDQGHTAFQAVVAAIPGTISSVNAANNSGIWAEIGSNESALVVRTGTPAPGIDNGIFATLSDPVFNSNDEIAFYGTVKTGTAGIVAANAGGIWTLSGGTLKLVVRAQSQAPGCPEGALFASFPQYVLPNQGGVVFLGNLATGTALLPAGGGVVPANNQGIWAVDTNGALQLIVRKGDTQQINGVSKVISSLAIFAPTTASAGQSRSFNSPGDLIFKVTFTDGSQTIEKVVFP